MWFFLISRLRNRRREPWKEPLLPRWPVPKISVFSQNPNRIPDRFASGRLKGQTSRSCERGFCRQVEWRRILPIGFSLPDHVCRITSAESRLSSAEFSPLDLPEPGGTVRQIGTIRWVWSCPVRAESREGGRGKARTWKARTWKAGKRKNEETRKPESGNGKEEK